MHTVLDRLAARDPRDGPLPPLLISLTVVTGLVDAVSYLTLGQVFVANMTGNVVFLGFAVADAEDFSVPASGVGGATRGLPLPICNIPSRALPLQSHTASGVTRAVFGRIRRKLMQRQ